MALGIVHAYCIKCRGRRADSSNTNANGGSVVGYNIGHERTGPVAQHIRALIYRIVDVVVVANVVVLGVVVVLVVDVVVVGNVVVLDVDEVVEELVLVTVDEVVVEVVVLDVVVSTVVDSTSSCCAEKS